MTKRLAIIDGKSVFYRGYYSMPGLSTSDGTPTGGVFGFASIAIEIIKKLSPDYIAIAWDIKGTSAQKRIEIYPKYKAGRTKPPEDFYTQLPILRELLDAFGWPLYELDGYEADDIMGTFAHDASEQGVHTYLITGDYDMLQLISPSTDVFITRTGSTDLVHYHKDTFRDKYGVDVAQFVDYKALVGDSSDNIPGVRKIGPVAAQKLLTAYTTLEGVYEHIGELKGAQRTYLEEDKDVAFMSQKLAAIFTDAPIKIDWHEADIKNTNFEAIISVLKKYEFNSLIRRLPDHMHLSSGEELKIVQNQVEKLEVVAWPETLMIEGPIILEIYEDELWMSMNSKTVSHIQVGELDRSSLKVFELATVISYDSKILYHKLASANIFIKFGDLFDIHQAAFLLNSLNRDRTISGLFGGEVSDEPASQIAALWTIYEQQKSSLDANPELSRVAYELDFPLSYILFMMEHQGIKIDKDILSSMSESLGTDYKKFEQDMYSMAGYDFNIASPAQLSEVLFTKLQLPTAGIKKGKTGYSTGQKELDKLRGKHPIIELIEKTRELAKLKNTYVDALPLLADENSRIHTTFNQDVASTGRLSSTNPNLQNIPIRSELGRTIRTAFVTDEDKVFISADYSQFELRLAAILAGDAEMINDFNGNVDIHTKTASEVYGIPMDDVTKNQRRDAKVINFGILYGMSPHGLSAATGMNFFEAKKFIDKYFELRSPIRKYIDSTILKAKSDGYVETFYGRRRPTPDIISSNFMIRQSAERAAANMPIQGTEADLMKRAMLEVDKKLGGLGVQVLQIHDSILVEAPTENAEKVSDLLVEVMENIAPELKIKLKVDVSIGRNWGEL